MTAKNAWAPRVFLLCTERASSVHHQDVEDHHRRHAQDHGPDGDRPDNVLHAKALLFRDWIVQIVHDAPAFCVFCSYGDVTRRTLKSRPQYRSHLTAGATVDLPRCAPADPVSFPSASGRP